MTMERVRAIFSELGLAKVGSYIQSGNIFFDTDQTDRAVLTETIERSLEQALGYAVPVFLRSVAEIEQTLALDPFRRLTTTEDMRLCIVFTKQAVPTNLGLPLQSPKQDMTIIQTAAYEAFVVWHVINGRPPVSFSFMDKLLGKQNTTRFFHTTEKILAAAGK